MIRAIAIVLIVQNANVLVSRAADVLYDCTQSIDTYGFLGSGPMGQLIQLGQPSAISQITFLAGSGTESSFTDQLSILIYETNYGPPTDEYWFRFMTATLTPTVKSFTINVGELRLPPTFVFCIGLPDYSPNSLFLPTSLTSSLSGTAGEWFTYYFNDWHRTYITRPYAIKLTGTLLPEPLALWLALLSWSLPLVIVRIRGWRH